MLNDFVHSQLMIANKINSTNIETWLVCDWIVQIFFGMPIWKQQRDEK